MSADLSGQKMESPFLGLEGGQKPPEPAPECLILEDWDRLSTVHSKSPDFALHGWMQDTDATSVIHQKHYPMVICHVKWCTILDRNQEILHVI